MACNRSGALRLAAARHSPPIGPPIFSPRSLDLARSRIGSNLAAARSHDLATGVCSKARRQGD